MALTPKIGNIMRNTIQNNMFNVVKQLNTLQFKEALENAEKEVYLAAYKYAGGNQTRTAKLLGVARGTLITKVKQFGLVKTVVEKGE